jgi:hypothetical protein
MTFGYLWTLLVVCVEQLILGDAYDEYMVLAWKSGMIDKLYMNLNMGFIHLKIYFKSFSMSIHWPQTTSVVGSYN